MTAPVSHAKCGILDGFREMVSQPNPLLLKTLTVNTSMRILETPLFIKSRKAVTITSLREFRLTRVLTLQSITAFQQLLYKGLRLVRRSQCRP